MSGVTNKCLRYSVMFPLKADSIVTCSRNAYLLSHFSLNSTVVTPFKTLKFSFFTCPDSFLAKAHWRHVGSNFGIAYYVPITFSANFSCFCKVNSNVCILSSESKSLCLFHPSATAWKCINAESHTEGKVHLICLSPIKRQS